MMFPNSLHYGISMLSCTTSLLLGAVKRENSG